MESFWNGFEKRASALAHATELAGLGTLAYPSIQGLRGKHVSDATKDKAELAGLGILAVPSAVAAGGAAKKMYKILRAR